VVSLEPGMQLHATVTVFKLGKIATLEILVRIESGEYKNNTILLFSDAVTDGLDVRWDVGS
jgi:hypothetical protein